MALNWKVIGNIISSDESLKSVIISNVSISNDGKRVIIGTPELDNNKGAVLIYDLINSEWNKNIIHGEHEDDRVGYSVSLSGNVIA